jgi:uncharacterized protein YjbI with pentapeptide repeats
MSGKTDWAAKIADEAPDLRGQNLEGECFSGVSLTEQDFRRAILRRAEFINCDLTGANFADADLTASNFKGAKLENVDFSNANLSRANFYQAQLVGAVFVGANLYFTTFRESTMGQTVFALADMDTCIGLDSITHKTSSSVAVECLTGLGENLPLKFLEGAGFTEILLQYLPSLIEAAKPIRFHSCFISYSHLDESFARKLWARMRQERISVWYAPEELKGGQKLFDQIDRAIQMHDKLLIVLSKSSMVSNWVQTEIRHARKQEKLTGERKLFPIRLCDMDTLKSWECFDADSGRDIAVEIREYFIPDFSDWNKPPKDPSHPPMFEASFGKLLRDLQREGVQTRSVHP